MIPEEGHQGDQKSEASHLQRLRVGVVQLVGQKALETALEAFKYLKGATREQDRDFSHGHVKRNM